MIYNIEDDGSTRLVPSPAWIDLPQGTVTEQKLKRAAGILYSELANRPDQAQYLRILKAVAKRQGISARSFNQARLHLGTTDYQIGHFDERNPKGIPKVLSLRDRLSVKVDNKVADRKWRQYGEGVENPPLDFSNPLYLAATQWAYKGRPTFPLVPGAKTPLTTHGFEDATTDPDLIERRWTRTPSANVGLATGNGLVVVDLDIKRGPDGIANWEAICEAHGFDWRTTLLVETPSGGIHAYYHDAPGHASGSSRPGTVLEGVEGIDLKGEGGYVVVAPSPLDEYDGRAYKMLNPGAPIATMPLWFYGVPETVVARWQLSTASSSEVDALAQQLRREYEAVPGKRWSDKLTAMVTVGEKKADQSQLLLNIMRSAVQQHLDLDMIYEALKNPINGGGKRLRQDIAALSEESGRKRIDDAIFGAFRLQAEALLQLQQLRTALEEIEVPKKVIVPNRRTGELVSCRGRSIRKGIDGVLIIAERNRTVSPMLGVWDLKDAAALGSKDTARKVLLALEWLGILSTPQDVSRTYRQEAYRYTILDGTKPPHTVGQVVRVNRPVSTSVVEYDERWAELKALKGEHERWLIEHGSELTTEAPNTRRSLRSIGRSKPLEHEGRELSEPHDWMAQNEAQGA